MTKCKACGEEFTPSRAGQFFCKCEACIKDRRNKRAREHMRAKRGNKARVRKEAPEKSEPKLCECGTRVYGRGRWCGRCTRLRYVARQEAEATARRQALGPCSGVTLEDVEHWS